MNTQFSFMGFCCCSLLLSATAATAQGPAKAPQVSVARPVVRKVTDYEVFSGRTEASSRVELRCRVGGYLQKVDFVEGSEVKEGDLLFEIDPRSYRTELELAQAALNLADARLRLTETNFKRAAALQASGAISKEEFAKIVAERAEAEGAVRVAKITSEAARLKLDSTRILAPIAGRIGRVLVDPGNLVKAEETLLAVLVSLEPMHAYFDIDERSLLRLQRRLRDRDRTAKLTAEIALADDIGFPHQGVIDFVDNQVDPATGALRLRAALPNKGGLLTPGMFVRMRLALGQPFEALLIPGQAIMADEQAPYVFVVDDNNVLRTQPVKLGRVYDGLHAVEAGLQAQDRVVISGLGRLRPGLIVAPRLEAVPEANASEAPNDTRLSLAPAILARGASGPGILVEATYPGASAADVAENVCAPIEQMVGGASKLKHMRSRCTNAGQLTIALTFTADTDLQRLQGATQNRVNVALPKLPEPVKQSGINITQGASGVLAIFALVSPNRDRDSRYLASYATIQIKDGLTRLEGVADVKLIGGGEYGMRVALDPAKLAELKLNVDEVSRQLATVKDAGGITQESLTNLILKADDEGRVIRLRDVARIELGATGQHSDAFLDGNPGVAIVVFVDGEADARETRDAVQRTLAQVRDRLPSGVALEEVLTSGASAEYLLVDVDVPITAVRAAAGKALSRCSELLQTLPGVQHVLALSENPFDLFGSSPCALIQLAPAEATNTARQKVVESIRTRLTKLDDASVRIRTSGDLQYPIDLMLSGPDARRVRDWAFELGERLERSEKLADVWVNRDAVPQLNIRAEVDREAAATRGVSLSALTSALQVYLGGQHAGDFNAFGRTWRIDLQADTGSADRVAALRQLKIRNARGQMIPLNAMLTLRESASPRALHFLDGWPAVGLTANPNASVPLEVARKLCQRAAEETRNDLGLGPAYRIVWLRDR